MLRSPIVDDEVTSVVDLAITRTDESFCSIARRFHLHIEHVRRHAQRNNLRRPNGSLAALPSYTRAGRAQRDRFIASAAIAATPTQPTPAANALVEMVAAEASDLVRRVWSDTPQLRLAVASRQACEVIRANRSLDHIQVLLDDLLGDDAAAAAAAAKKLFPADARKDSLGGLVKVLVDARIALQSQERCLVGLAKQAFVPIVEAPAVQDPSDDAEAIHVSDLSTEDLARMVELIDKLDAGDRKRAAAAPVPPGPRVVPLRGGS